MHVYVGVNQSFLLNTSSYLASIHGVSECLISSYSVHLFVCQITFE